MDNFAVRFSLSVVTGSLAPRGKRNVNQCLQPDDKTLLEPKHEKEKQIRSREESIFHSVATDWDPAAPLFWTSLSLLAQNNYFSFRIHLQLCTFDTWSFFSMHFLLSLFNPILGWAIAVPKNQIHFNFNLHKLLIGRPDELINRHSLFHNLYFQHSQ